jgi:hypothetical protein
MKTIIFLIIVLKIVELLKADNIAVTVPVITITQNTTISATPSTNTNYVTVTSSPNTNYFTDTEAVNTLIALVITILTAITAIATTIFTCKRQLAKKARQINRLNNAVTTNPPGYQTNTDNPFGNPRF